MLKQHITQTYGEVTQKQTTRLQKLKKQKASTKCRWIFLSKCVKHSILPKSFTTRPLLRTKRGITATHNYNKGMLKLTRDEAKIHHIKLCKKIHTVNNDLKNKLSEQDYAVIQNVTEKSRENKFLKERNRLKEKFTKLDEKNESSKKKKQPTEATQLKNQVYDLTRDGVDDDVKAYLKLGPDFSSTPKRLPYEKMIIETEKMCKIIEDEGESQQDKMPELERESHKLREKVKHIINKNKDRIFESNLTKEEERGREKASKDTERVFLPADKGKVMVAMDKTIEVGGENSYEHKMKKVMEDMRAKPAVRANEDWDLTEKVSRDGRAIIKEMVEKEELTKEKARKLNPTDCRAPRITGYPKIHKEGVPLRGVVSFINSPYEKIGKELLPILRSLQGRTNHYIKNSRQLKEELKTWTVKRDEYLVSFDVEALYPSIPIAKALELIECLLKSKPNMKDVTTFSVNSIMKLLKWIFAVTYCEYGGKHYILDCGPIGLNVVGEVAIIYMEDFQMRSHSDEYPELNQWPWYVDDSVLKCKKERTDTILAHLNSIEPGHIRFTKEEEVEEKLPMLDLELTINRKSKKIEFAVHYKKTHTNITIKKKSNHKESVKKAVIKGYADRARALCDEQHLEAEMDNIADVFKANGYEEKEIKEAMKQRERREGVEEDKRGVISMPNIPGVTPQFARVAKQHGFRLVNNTDKRVRDLSTSAKTPLGDKNSCVVYNIPCKCGKFSYTGETDRMFKTRKKEHEDKVRLTKGDVEAGRKELADNRMNSSDGGLAKHAVACEQDIDWEKGKIIGKEKGWTQRKYLEGIESLRRRNQGIKPLNIYNQMEQWQPILLPIFEGLGER